MSDAQWLTALVLGAASAVPMCDGDECLAICGKNGDYIARNIRDPIATTPRFRLYGCDLPDGRKGVLKIATDVANNAALDREAILLGEYYEEARRIDAGLPREQRYQYGNFAPVVEESFISDTQMGRRVNVLSFTLYDGLGETVVNRGTGAENRTLIPLCCIWERGQERVDPKTAAWIFGKALKVEAKANDLGVMIGDMTPSNILISAERHGVVVFDWTQATRISDPGDFPLAAAMRDMSQIARGAIEALGGDYEKRYLPPSDQLPNSRFQKFLWRVAAGQTGTAFEEHEAFYKLIYELWPHGFHPYTTYPKEA
jgi:hypothetical protein